MPTVATRQVTIVHLRTTRGRPGRRRVREGETRRRARLVRRYDAQAHRQARRDEGRQEQVTAGRFRSPPRHGEPKAGGLPHPPAGSPERPRGLHPHPRNAPPFVRASERRRVEASDASPGRRPGARGETPASWQRSSPGVLLGAPARCWVGRIGAVARREGARTCWLLPSTDAGARSGRDGKRFAARRVARGCIGATQHRVRSRRHRARTGRLAQSLAF
jgi:hypothetical protein